MIYVYAHDCRCCHFGLHHFLAQLAELIVLPVKSFQSVCLEYVLTTVSQIITTTLGRLVILLAQTY